MEEVNELSPIANKDLERPLLTNGHRCILHVIIQFLRRHNIWVQEDVINQIIDNAQKQTHSYQVKHVLRSAQVVLSTFRLLQRGILPESWYRSYLSSLLSPGLRMQLEEDAAVSAQNVEPPITRAQLAFKVLQNPSKYSRLAVLPAEVSSQVLFATRTEKHAELLQCLQKKFLRSSLRAPDQIFQYLIQEDIPLVALSPAKRIAADEDSLETVVSKLNILSTPSKAAAGMSKRGSTNPIFWTFNKLRQQGVKGLRLQVSRTLRLKEEVIYRYRVGVDQRRHKRESRREIARQTASRVVTLEMRKAAAAEREQRDRMRALREQDMESYMRLVKQTKNKRIHEILNHTEKLLQDIGAKIELERTAAQEKEKKLDKKGEAEEVAPSAISVSEETVQPAGEEKKYYILSHRRREAITQPEILSGGKLMHYQIAGVEFLVSLYNNNLSGILADEMGLGKTIQTIAFLAYLKEKKNNPGPHLIAVPLGTLPNWASEFEKWCPSIKVLQYRGNKTERYELNKELRRGKFYVLLTTFEYILREKRVLNSPKWRCLIVDEGHKMKNVKSKFHATLSDFPSTHRVLLTGTPLQNNLNELWSLLNFLMPQTFASAEDFEKWFEEPFRDQFTEAQREEVALTEEEKLVVINRLHLVLRPFLLRRVKADVLSDLPSKREFTLRIQLSKWQELVYEQLVNKSLKIRDSTGTITTKSVANVIMQLRKVVNHPYLFLDQYNLDDNLWRVSGKFEVLDRMIPKLLAFKHKLLIFCQMTQLMDILGDYLETRGYRYHRLDGSMMVGDRQERTADFNDEATDTHIFILSTRAGGLGLNLQAADTVILFDSDWNPHADLQAQARAHRVGQKREVLVFRFVTISPVEELILARAQHKLSIDEQIIQAGMFSSKFNDAEREQKLRTLLSQKTGTSTIRVTTPQELVQNMARSVEEEETFTEMDRELFGETLFTQLYEQDQTMDDSEGALASQGPTGEGLVGDDTSESAHAVADEVAANVAQREKTRAEEILIASGRLISEKEIPQDIVLIKDLPKDEESLYSPLPAEPGPRRSNLRTAMAEKQQKLAAAESSSRSPGSRSANRRSATNSSKRKAAPSDPAPPKRKRQ